jgi:hypothetical protein
VAELAALRGPDINGSLATAHPVSLTRSTHPPRIKRRPWLAFRQRACAGQSLPGQQLRPPCQRPPYQRPPCLRRRAAAC